MARTLTPPIESIPVGLIELGGRTVEVRQHPEFVRFFFDLFRRVGGVSAATNVDLEAMVTSATMGVFAPRHDNAPAIGDVGYMRSFIHQDTAPSEPASISYVEAFAHRKQEQSSPLADASAVICSRVFRAR